MINIVGKILLSKLLSNFAKNSTASSMLSTAGKTLLYSNGESSHKAGLNTSPNSFSTDISNNGVQ